MAKETIELIITLKDKDKRLDKFLVEKLPEDLSRSFIQKLVLKNAVLVNGEPAKCHHYVDVSDRITVAIPEPEISKIEPEKIPLKVVYEDKDVIVINKSADMVVHPAPGNRSGTLVNALLAHCKNLSGIGGVLKPGIVHRLDKGTSGLLVAAKNDEAHRSLARQFKSRRTKRLYIAVVHGVVELDNGIVDLPIMRSLRDRKRMAVRFDEYAKEAITQYHVVERFKDATLLEVMLKTGRTHQIRVHMSHIGHPLIGDDAYGAKRASFPRPALHAKTIGFTHPVTKKMMEFTSELPTDMKRLIKKLRTESCKKR